MVFHENQCLQSEKVVGEFVEDERVWIETDGETVTVGFEWRFPMYLDVEILGTYQHGPSGHLATYPGRIVRVRRITAVGSILPG